MTTYYKVTGPAGEPINGGSGAWSLPKRVGRRWKPGAWRRAKGPLELCRNGLHLVEEGDVGTWLRGDCVVWEAEARGRILADHNKVAVREARLLRPIAKVNPGQWARFQKVQSLDQPTLAAFRVFQRQDARIEAAAQRQRAREAKAAAVAAEAERKRREEMFALTPGQKLIFGQHRMEHEPARTCPAWPSLEALEKREWRKTVRRTAKILGIPPKLDRAALQIAKEDPAAAYSLYKQIGA
jgi:hypothetical protein